MALTLKLGTLDLTSYARLNPDDGFDPYDGGGFQDPQWLDSPVADGQLLTSVNVTNREMAWPLYLKAADKQALHDLIVTINRVIANTAKPLRTEWQDAGAAASTFHDVGFVRFDPDYNFRRAGKSVLAGVLRVWGSPPWGHTATERIVATAAGTFPVATMPIASLGGDVPAQLKVTLNAGARYSGANVDKPGVMTALSVLSPGWTALAGASELADAWSVAQGATLVGASGAIGSQVVRRTSATGAGAFSYVGGVTRSATAHFSRTRVILKARSNASPPFDLWLGDIGGLTRYGPTVSVPTVAEQNDWMLIDMGVLDFDYDVQQSFAAYVFAGCASQGTGTRYFDTNAALLLPEDSTAIFWEQPIATTGAGSIVASYLVNGVTNKSLRVEPQPPAYFTGDGSAEISAKRRGPIPQVMPGATQTLLVAQIGSTDDVNNSQLTIEVRARERFTFAR